MASKNAQSFYLRYVQRVLDLVLLLPCLIVFGPVMAVLALVIRVNMGSPALFSQVRSGLNGRPFTLYKFRTMTNQTGPDGSLVPDCQRLTPLGAFIRSTSLDELPQLWNVLRGEMSMVGPRPLPLVFAERYSLHQARRLEVKPGITGWTAVKGRSALEWDTKFDLDVWYVDHVSLFLDLKILALTLFKVVKREGISYPGEVNSKTFLGTTARGQVSDKGAVPPLQT